MLNNVDKLKAYADKHDWLNKQDFDRILDDPDLKEEYIANAFGQYMEDQYRSSFKPIDNSLPFMFKKGFKEAYNFIEKFKNGLRGLGFKSFEDVLQEGTTGKLKPNFEEKLQEFQDLRSTARASRIAEKREKLDAIENQKDWLDHVKETRLRDEKDRKSVV